MAATPSQATAQQALAHLVATRGAWLANDPTSLRTMLTEEVAGLPQVSARDVAALVALVESQAAALVGHDRVGAEQLAASAAARQGLTPDEAGWALDAWTEALSPGTPSAPVPTPPAPAPTPPAPVDDAPATVVGGSLPGPAPAPTAPVPAPGSVPPTPEPAAPTFVAPAPGAPVPGPQPPTTPPPGGYPPTQMPPGVPPAPGQPPAGGYPGAPAPAPGGPGTPPGYAGSGAGVPPGGAAGGPPGPGVPPGAYGAPGPTPSGGGGGGKLVALIGIPVAVLLLLVVGAIILVTRSGEEVVLGGDPTTLPTISTPGTATSTTEPPATTRPRRTTTTSTRPKTTTTTTAAWQTFTPPDGTFSIDFPGTPTAKTETVPVQGENATQKTYAVQSDADYFGIAQFELPPGFYIPDPMTFLNNRADAVIDGGEFGTLKTRDQSDFAGNPALLLSFQDGAIEAKVFVLVAGNRVYTIGAAGLFTSEFDRFRNSFQIH